MQREENPLKRSEYLVKHKFRSYLLPTTLTALAMSLNEFVDSLVVAHLLDAQAMSVINICSPVMLLICAVYALIGIGGSTIFAILTGQRENRKAGTVLGVCMLAAVAGGLILTVAGLLFQDPLSHLLCNEESIRVLMPEYLRTLICSAPVIVIVMVISYFLPASGHPQMATVLTIVANAVNLLFDVIYIRLFGMGVEGAAYATLTGYGCALLLVLILMVGKKLRFNFVMPRPGDLKLLASVSGQGASSALTQFGYSLKYTTFNGLAALYGGASGLIAFSVCMQIVSIVSIGLSGVMDSMIPITATLMGQKDKKGVRAVVKNSYFLMIAISLVCVIVMEAFPGILFSMFNVTNAEDVAVTVTAVRIFSLSLLARSVYILIMHYARLIGQKTYAVILSMLDGFILPILAAQILSRLFGLSGVWLGYVMGAVLTIGCVLIGNKRVERVSGGQYSGFLLLDKQDTPSDVYDFTVTQKDSDISDMSRSITGFCEDRGVEHGLASRVGLLSEEMALYTRQHHNKTALIDVMIRLEPEEITLDFRSEGAPFDPLSRGDEDIPENLLVLQKMSGKIVYDYILGMNSTRITVGRNKKPA